MSLPSWAKDNDEPKQRISFDLRRDLFDWLETAGHHWAGRREEVAFLGRLWDLDKLPSTDSRFDTAKRDIVQHREYNPQDWPDDWVFDDSRFKLKSSSDDKFLDFLVATVGPKTGRDSTAIEEIVTAYNDALLPVGFELYVKATAVGGVPVFGWRDASGGHHVPTTHRLAGPDFADRVVLGQHLQKIKRDIESDPAAAIDTSKNLVESLCKIVLDDRGAAYTDRDELPALFKKVLDELGINAESVPGSRRGSEAMRKMLRTLSTTVQAIAETRNSIGDGHGSATPSPAEPRHARLAFNSTVAVAEFVVDTWKG